VARAHLARGIETPAGHTSRFSLLGLNILVGLNLPAWVLDSLALIAGVLLLAERFGITTRRK